MTHVVLFRRLVVNELFVLLIQAEIGQVRVFSSTRSAGIVLVHSESDQTLIENIDSPRIHTRNHHIETQVKFQSIYQEGVVNVPADDTVLINRHFRYIMDLQNTGYALRVKLTI